MSQHGPFMMQNISKMLKNERLRRDLTVSQAATECQLIDDVYLRIETAKKALTTKELCAIASFLGTEPEALLNTGVQNETIKYRADGDSAESSLLKTVETAKRLFEEMIAQSFLREN